MDERERASVLGPSAKPMIHHGDGIIGYYGDNRAHVIVDRANDIPIFCGAFLMFEALKAVRSDPKFKHLSAKTKESVLEALACTE